MIEYENPGHQQIDIQSVMKEYALGNVCLLAHEIGFMASRTYIREAMNPCLCEKDK